MEWWQWLLILMLVGQTVSLVMGYLIISGLAQLVNSIKTLIESMQTLSDQMTDVEERTVESQTDVRKITQHFVNFAKSMKNNQDKPWYTDFR